MACTGQTIRLATDTSRRVATSVKVVCRVATPTLEVGRTAIHRNQTGLDNHNTWLPPRVLSDTSGVDFSFACSHRAGLLCLPAHLRGGRQTVGTVAPRVNRTPAIESGACRQRNLVHVCGSTDCCLKANNGVFLDASPCRPHSLKGPFLLTRDATTLPTATPYPLPHGSPLLRLPGVAVFHSSRVCVRSRTPRLCVAVTEGFRRSTSCEVLLAWRTPHLAHSLVWHSPPNRNL